MSSIVQLSFPASMILEHALLPYHSSEDASPAPSRLKFNWHVFKVLKCIFELKCSTKFARFLASLSSFWWFTHQVFPPAGPEFGRGGGSAWQHMDPFILLLVYPTALEEVSNAMTMYTSRIVFDWSKVLGEQSIPAHAPLSIHEWGVHYCPPVFGSFPQSTGLSHRLIIILVGVSPSLVHIPGSSPRDATVSSNVSGGETSKVVECHCTLGAKRFHSGEQGAMLGEMWWWVKMGKDGQRWAKGESVKVVRLMNPRLSIGFDRVGVNERWDGVKIENLESGLE